jgi:hypothetical protein
VAEARSVGRERREYSVHTMGRLPQDGATTVPLRRDTQRELRHVELSDDPFQNRKRRQGLEYEVSGTVSYMVCV